MTDYKFNEKIVNDTYQWTKDLKETALFDLLLSKSAAFRLSGIKDATVIIASEIKGIEKVIREKYTEEEIRNILMNAVIFGEKVSAAVKASVIAEHTLIGTIPGPIHNKNTECPPKLMDVDIPDDEFNNN